MADELIFEDVAIEPINFLTDYRGDSLYIAWLELGHEGSKADFLQWLKIKGDTGLNAYEIAVELGFEGTDVEWIASTQKPALDAALVAIAAANTANEAATQANAKAELANTATINANNAEDIRAAAENAREANKFDPTTEKTTPIDADSLGLWNSVTSKFVRISLTNFKTFLSSFFETKTKVASNFMFNLWNTYLSRVQSNSGSVRNETLSKAYIQFMIDNDLLDTVKFAWIAEAGSTFRTSTIYTYFTRIFSLIGGNDATQSTANNQPFIGGNIATNERFCLKNPTGGSSYMIHPLISFESNEAWSITTVLNSFGKSIAYNSPFGNEQTDRNRVLFESVNGRVHFTNNSAIGQNFNFYINQDKNSILTLTASGNGVLIAYLNGVNVGSISINTDLKLSRLMQSYGTSLYNFYGKIYAQIIRSQSLTQAQIAIEHNLFRSYIPEIESINIGAQIWATTNSEFTATPMNNLIAEMQSSLNVEKITNTTFDTSVGWFSLSASMTISGGALNYNGISDIQSASISASIVQDKWYKLTTVITSGQAYFTLVNGVGSAVGVGGYLTHTVGTNVIYFKALLSISAGELKIITRNIAGGTAFAMDVFSIQEVGWSGSKELYDGIYAQTTGTNEQKTYAALKAASMFCYYNNDASLGAIYGKLYNWYAVKLFQLDIDYYNNSNPTSIYGWRIPTNLDWTELYNFIGGATSGGKMKTLGTAHWNPPNGSATNESGFSGLPNGARGDIDGVFGSYTVYTLIWLLSEISATAANRISLFYLNGNISTNSSAPKGQGHAIRLIKA